MNTLARGSQEISSPTITSLPSHDAVLPFILHHLSLKELFALRAVNTSWKQLVKEHFASLEEIDLHGVKSRAPFHVIFDTKMSATDRNYYSQNDDNQSNQLPCCCQKCSRKSPDQEIQSKSKSNCDNFSIFNSNTCNQLSPLVSLSNDHSNGHRKGNRLKKVNLFECKWLTDCDLMRVLYCGGFKSLQLLDVSACFEVSFSEKK